jgi:hypothetical protein
MPAVRLFEEISDLHLIIEHKRRRSFDLCRNQGGEEWVGPAGFVADT